MTKRTVVNIASTKKRDTLLHSGLLAADLTTRQSAVGTALNYSTYCWCPTWRDGNLLVAPNVRNSDLVYYKGLSERITVTATTDTQWKWRRIVFESKGNRPTSADVALTTSGAGYRRLFKPLPPAGTTSVGLKNELFAGVEGSDWSTIWTAKTSNLFKIHYDKTFSISSKTSAAHQRTLRFYHPFNRNFRYEEDEQGDSKSFGTWSARGTSNMGDIFVVDFIGDVYGVAPSGGPPAVTPDWIDVRAESTIYWHEK